MQLYMIIYEICLYMTMFDYKQLKFKIVGLFYQRYKNKQITQRQLRAQRG